MGPAMSLLNTVYQHLDDRYPGWRAMRQLPDGLRLEMHPVVYRKIMTDQETWAWGPQVDLSEHFQVPVKLTTELSAGTWRLVVVIENVLGSGTLTQPPLTIVMREDA